MSDNTSCQSKINKMTEWDKLWEDWTIYLEQYGAEWLKQVKAEGDANQMLAEKWFKLYKDLVEERKK